MRVGIISPYSLTLPGGVQGQILGLARALQASGVDARVLGPCDGPPPDPAVTPLGNSIPTAANGSVAPLAPDIPAQLRTIRALRDERFDVLNLHEPFAPGPNQTALMVKAAPAVGTFHASGESASYKYLLPLVRILDKHLEMKCAVSESARLLPFNAIGGDYEMVFNGVEVARYREVTPHPTGGPTIFFLARHEPRKGLAVLLETMRELSDQVCLWVGGDGPETAELRREYADDGRIAWLGRVSEAEKLARLAAADVFCAPSLGGESFGVVLLEAMAAGTPVVASAIDGYHTVAIDGVNALLPPPGDVRALAAGLRSVLEQPRLANGLRTAGATRADEYSMRRLAARYVELFERVIADHPRHG